MHLHPGHDLHVVAVLILTAGKMTGSCRVVDGNAIELNMHWGEPLAGRGRDFFR